MLTAAEAKAITRSRETVLAEEIDDKIRDIHASVLLQAHNGYSNYTSSSYDETQLIMMDQVYQVFIDRGFTVAKKSTSPRYTQFILSWD